MLLCTVLTVVTVIFLIYRWQEQMKGNNQKPIIYCPTERLYISVDSFYDDSILLNDVTAMDAEDGDISERVVVENISQFVEQGHCIITYAVTDHNKNVAKATRHLYLIDYVPPEFRITAPMEFSFSSNFNPLDYIEAYDCIEGNISNKIKLSQINADDSITSIGSHAVEFRVTNSRGDAAVLETEIVVYDRTYTEIRSIPQIGLEGYLVYVDQYDYLDPMSLVKGITLGGVVYDPKDYTFGTLNMDSVGLDFAVPGVYRVLFTCDYDEFVGSVVLLIVVKEVTL